MDRDQLADTLYILSGQSIWLTSNVSEGRESSAWDTIGITATSMKQYPKFTSQDALGEESVLAFNLALPDTKFYLRTETGLDKGADATLELLHNGSAMGTLCRVQLKGTDEPRDLQNGGLSLSVSVANLNYLRNSVSAIYVVFVRPRNELRFCWVRDEEARLDTENSGWQDQETVSLIFDRILDDDAFQEIHERTFYEAAVARKAVGKLRIANPNGLSTSPLVPKEYAFVKIGEMIPLYHEFLGYMIGVNGFNADTELGILLCEQSNGTKWTAFVEFDFLRVIVEGQSDGVAGVPVLPKDFIVGVVPDWPDTFIEFLATMVETNTSFIWSIHADGYPVLSQAPKG